MSTLPVSLQGMISLHAQHLDTLTLTHLKPSALKPHLLFREHYCLDFKQEGREEDKGIDKGAPGSVT